MIIIVEGPDGAGKTTMIEKLKKRYPAAMTFHFGAPVEGEDQLLRYAVPMLKHPENTLIYDRSWYSEFVYGPVMRNRHELRPEHSKLLEALAYKHGSPIVYYLTAPDEILWERCQERGETYIKDIKTLKIISSKYEVVMKHLPEIPVFRVDTSR